MGAIMTDIASSQEGREPSCLFCDLVLRRDREILAENGSFLAVFDNYPVNRGHVLLVSRRHVETPFELSGGEGADLTDILRSIKAILDERFRPDGYNLGINAGSVAGQTVSHVHVHLIPRYAGDVENPRGGIRNFKKPLVPY
jgi:diadenosine tetraphosphate (Ap4A) HIT family hydrolase